MNERPDFVEVFLGAVVFAALIGTGYCAVALVAVLMGTPL